MKIYIQEESPKAKFLFPIQGRTMKTPPRVSSAQSTHLEESPIEPMQ